MAMNWYLKKEFFDPSTDIESVTIHYTWGPLGAAPAWEAHRESRLMGADEVLKTGVGEVAKYGPAAPTVQQHIHPQLRKKILKLPNDIQDPQTGDWTGEYNLHYYYEIVQAGQRHYSPVFTDEIRNRMIVVLSPRGLIGGTCVYWAVYDWDAPQFSPTEEEQFVARFGEDHPLRQHKFYGTENREAFGVAKKAAVDLLPLPHRFATRISAPVGAPVRLRLHVGNWGLPEHERWEDYWLDETFIMTAGAEPLVLTPMGTEVTPEPVTRVTPDLLAGNPYAPLLRVAVG
ncbi:MAG TPA: hypothetical protein VHL09_03190 [Dehalococcoidia bacterium]|nr:hypothetical protein [Dehalococcoidia bacterium]